MPADRDPYAAPRRHRDSSGAIVRFLIIAVLLGAAAWGYLEFAQGPQTALVPAAEEESLADASLDRGYEVEPAQSDPMEDAEQPEAEPTPDDPPA